MLSLWKASVKISDCTKIVFSDKFQKDSKKKDGFWKIRAVLRTMQTSMTKTFENLNETLCYLLYNLKNVKSTHGEVLPLVKLQTFSKSPANPNSLTRIFY